MNPKILNSAPTPILPKTQYEFKSSLKIAYFNARSIVNKLKLFTLFTNFLCNITESWLNINILDLLFNFPGFSVIRDNRSYSKGGGVLILYKSTSNVIQFISPTISAFKYFVCLFIDVRDFKCCARFSYFYIPPSTSTSLANFTAACDCLNQCLTTAYPQFIVDGFNLPNFNWSVPNPHQS